jgi:hypothetical protein
MLSIASDTSKASGRVYVYCGKPMSGKTAAGRALLEFSGRGFLLKRGLFVSKEKGIPLVQTVAKTIGAPDTGDFEWVSTLFDALAGEESMTTFGTQKSMLNSFHSCGLVAPPQEQVVSGIGNEAPIVVFDDVRGKLEVEDERFVEKVYQLAQFKRVHVFVLTDDRQTANTLCKMNGRQRIKPMPGFYTGDPSGDDDVEWIEDAWLVPRLSALIFVYYPRIQASTEHLTEVGDAVNFVSNGTLPDVALQKASEIDKILSNVQRQRLGFDEMEFGFL